MRLEGCSYVYKITDTVFESAMCDETFPIMVRECRGFFFNILSEFNFTAFLYYIKPIEVIKLSTNLQSLYFKLNF